MTGFIHALRIVLLMAVCLAAVRFARRPNAAESR